MDALPAGVEIRRSATRGRFRNHWLDARFSFSFGSYRDPSRDNFGVLLALNEDVIQPGTGFDMHAHEDLEIFIMPLSGAVAHEDSIGNRATVRPGEVQKMTAGWGIRHSQMNASRTALDHHLQIWLRPRTRGLEPAIEQRGFDPSARAGAWQLLISPDGRDGSLAVDQDASVSVAVLRDAQRLSCRGVAARSQYLHVIRGDVTVAHDAGGRALLHAGDALAAAHAVDLELAGADAEAELLLFDLPSVLRVAPGPGGA